MAIKLGDISFALGADDKALAGSITKLKRFGRTVEQAAGQQGRAAQQAATALRKQERAIISALKKVQDLNAATRRLGADPTNLAAANRSFKAFTNTMSSGTLSALEFQRAQSRMGVSLGNVSRRLKDVASKKNTQGFRDISDRLRDVASAAVIASGPLNGLAARVTAFAAAAKRAGLATAAMITGIAAGAVAVGTLGGAVIRNARQLGIMRSQLESVTGSVSLTQVAFKEVVQISNRAGQSISALGSRYAKFNAAASGTVLEGRKAKEIFESVALVTGKLQLPVEQAQGIFKALEQIMSKGTVQAEELRNQLGDRLPGAFGLAAKAIGVTTAKLGEMLKNGEVLSDEFLPKFAAQLRKTFNVGDGVDTLQASINRLTNESTLFLDKLDSVLGISQAFKSAIEGTAGAIRFLRENLETLLVVLGGVAGGLLALSGGAIIAGIVRVASLIRGMTAAMIGLNIAIISNPVGGLVALLVRLAIAIAGAIAGMTGMQFLLGETTSEFDSLNTQVDDFIEAADRMNGVIGDTGNILKQQLIDRIAGASIEMHKLTVRIRELANENLFQQAIRSLASGIGAPVDTINDLLKKRADLMKQQAADEERLQKLYKAIDDRRAAAGGTGGGGGAGRSGPSPTSKPTSYLEDLASQQEALVRTETLFGRMQERLEAVREGGVPALKELNQQFEQQDKIENFRDMLEQAGLATGVINERVEQFTKTLVDLGAATAEAMRMEEIINTLQSTVERSFERMGDAIADMVANGKLDLGALSDVYKGIISDILKETIRLAVIRPLMNSIFGGGGGGGAAAGGGGGAGFLSGLFGARKGAAFSGGMRKLAKGGLLERPTIFSSMSGPVLAGEAGTEAVMPLKRTATGELGVASSGGGAPQVNVTIMTNDLNSFSKSEGQVAAQLSRAVRLGGRNM